MDGGDEIGFGGVLDEIAAGAGLESAKQIGLVGMHAENDGLGERMRGGELGDGFDAVENGHADVDHHDVRMESGGEFESLAAVGGLGDDFEAGVALQQKAQAGAHEGMVIGEQDADGAHSPTATGGGRGSSNGELSAAAGFRVDLQRASEVGDAFLHADEAEAAFDFGLEALAVVLNGEEEAVGLLTDSDADGLRLGVLGAVVQGFLDDAVDAGFMLLGEVFGNAVGGDVDAETGAF